MNSVAQSVYNFWFGTNGLSLDTVKVQSKLWWKGSADIDYDIERRFGKLVEAAGKGAFTDWMEDAKSALALIILHDQFPRNLYRGTAKAFNHDIQALECAKQLTNSALFEKLEPVEKAFALMPFEHSEHIEDQKFCVAQFELLAESAIPEWKDNLKAYHRFALDHMEIIERFGRFPHRNQVLGRKPSEEELNYLESGGRNFGQ